MNRDEYFACVSEIKELEMLLKKIPAANVIDRHSLMNRLEMARSKIIGISEPAEDYKAKLTFRGKPVLGSHGIIADFGLKAANTFAEAVTAIAVGSSENLPETGPIPGGQKNQLIITGIAIGSFGFEFELPHSDEKDFSNKIIENALQIIMRLFQSSAEGTDDDIAEQIEEIQPRALKKTAEFLSYVAQHGAWCAVDFKDKVFGFQNLNQITNSSKRLQENYIHERKDKFEGEFQGCLPLSRSFEFKFSETSEIIKGKISANVKDPNIINREFLNKHVLVEINITQVGNGKPRYTLLSIDPLN